MTEAIVWPLLGLTLALALAAFIVWLMSDREESMTVTVIADPIQRESYDVGDYPAQPYNVETK